MYTKTDIFKRQEVTVLRLSLLCLMLFITTTQAADNWKVLPIRSQYEFEHGMVGGEGQQCPLGIARCDSDPNYIYWAHDGSGPWKSSNGGASWKRCLSHGIYSVGANDTIQVDPVNPNIVFTVSSSLWYANDTEFDGLYRSTDGGNNWSLVLPTSCGIDWNKHRYIKSNIACDPNTKEATRTKVWYVVFHYRASPPTGWGHGGVFYKSSDYGDTWSQLATTTIDKFYQIVVGDSNRVYLGTDDGLRLYTPETGTLNALGDLPTGAVTSVFVHPTTKSTIFATVLEIGLYKSTDSGVHFTQIKANTDTWAAFYNTGHPDTIYLVADWYSTGRRTAVTQNGGTTWTEIGDCVDVPALQYPVRIYGAGSGIVSSATDPNDAVAFTQAQIYKTTNGATFNRSQTLFTGYSVVNTSSFAFDQFDPNRFALGLADVGYTITTNGGDWFYNNLNTSTGGLISDWTSAGWIAGPTIYCAAIDFKPVSNSETMASLVGYNGQYRKMYLANETTGWALDTTFQPNPPTPPPLPRPPSLPNTFLQYHRTDPNIVFAGNTISTDGGVSYAFLDWFAQHFNMVLNDANHLDAGHAEIENVYSEIVTKDSVFSPPVNDGEYVRVKFAVNLTPQDNYLEFYATSTGASTIYVYVKDGSTSYASIAVNTEYKVRGFYLNTLPAGYDTLDLKVTGDPVIFDFIDEVSIYPTISGSCRTHPNIVYAVFQSGQKVTRSEDKGVTWTRVVSESNKFYIMAIDPCDPNIFYSLYQSEDIGRYEKVGSTWTKTNLGLLPNITRPSTLYTVVQNITIDPRHPEIIYVSVSGSGISPIWRTIDSGVTWVDISANLPEMGPYVIAVSPLTGELFAGGLCGTYVLPPPYPSSNTTYNKCASLTSSNSSNQAPVFASIGNQSVNENALLTFTVSATDADDDTITYLSAGSPTGAALSGQTFNWTPSYSQAGAYQVSFTASDSQAQDSEIITITVNNVNRSPVLTAIGDKAVNENTLLSFSVSASDADGDTIEYLVKNLPSGAALVGQSFTWTPGYDQAGTHQVTFIAADGEQDSETITVTVSNINRPPVLSAIGDKSVYANDPLTFTIDATDVDSDTIQYSAQTLPAGAAFAAQTFIWTPADSQAGSHQLTFIASDGQAQDSETIAIVVNADDVPPTVTNSSPADDSIQVPLNNLITLHITDAGEGVDANSVTIRMDNSVVYTGNTTDYSSTSGRCRRIGNKSDYTFIYQAGELFDFDRTVSITVNATDLAANQMDEHSYAFRTEMRSFGKNKKASSLTANNASTGPVTVRDSTGNIWAAWHAGSADSRDIYIAKLTLAADNFENTIQITNNAADQYNAAFAIDADDKLYLVWQDNRNGDWDIYISTSVDGTTWSAETLVCDSNDNQTNPAIVVDGSSARNACVVWQDDRAGNQDIYVAFSSSDFASKNISQITTNSANQTEPAIAVDSANTVYVVWTDARNRTNDIYGAASDNGWTNVPVVSKDDKQKSPAIAAEDTGSVLHLLWIDDSTDDDDIFYAATAAGLPTTPLTGTSIIDDTIGADQLEPVIAVSGSTGSGLKVFASWQDERNINATSRDTDIYFVEISSGAGTNVFVGDDGTNASQVEPAIGIDEYGHPYLVWGDDRNLINNIYFAASTFIKSAPLASRNVSASSGTTVGTEPVAINAVDDVSIIVPPSACLYDVNITISEVKNPQAFAMQCLGSYDFGPSGIEFSQPVTVTIPYSVSSQSASALPYWYNSLTGALSQQGITDVEAIVISSSLHAIRFKTTHFTQFILLAGGAAAAVGGGGGGGGCSISTAPGGNIIDFILPYLALAVVMVTLKIKDKRNSKTSNITQTK